MVQAPVPVPVVIASVASVVDMSENVPTMTFVEPLTEFCTVTIDPLVQLVPTPSRVIVIGIPTFWGTTDGLAENEIAGAGA